MVSILKTSFFINSLYENEKEYNNEDIIDYDAFLVNE
jgi:hypothetical protein